MQGYRSLCPYQMYSCTVGMNGAQMRFRTWPARPLQVQLDTSQGVHFGISVPILCTLMGRVGCSQASNLRVQES